MIINTRLIGDNSALIFATELDKIVMEIQSRGNIAQVQFSTTTTLIGGIQYTALILEVRK